MIKFTVYQTRDDCGDHRHWTFITTKPDHFPEEFLLFDRSDEPDCETVVWVPTHQGALRAYDYLLERDWEPESVYPQFEALMSGTYSEAAAPITP